RVLQPRSCVYRSTALLVEHRSDDRREVVARPAQAALHGAEVHARDLGDLLVGLPLQLPQHEHLAVVRRQLVHGLLDLLTEMTLPEQIVRPVRVALELERTMIRVPAPLDLLEEYER